MSPLPETNIDAARQTAQTQELRARMVETLREQGYIRTSRIEQAFRTVPRHVFAPDVPLENAYAPFDSVVTKRDEQALPISSVSAPHVQAMMLEQAGITDGMRVLEIGSGGYNAALIAELVGEHGQVTSVDIDPEVVDRARGCLAVAGYEQVNVVLGDAEDGVPDRAHYDRVIVTVSAWDIPPPWMDELSADGGRLVVPLEIRGLARTIAFERVGEHLVSLTHDPCGFVPMRGTGAHHDQTVHLAGEDVVLCWDDEAQVDADRLGEALARPRIESWSQVTLRVDERLDGLHLWLATVLPDFFLLITRKDAVDRGIVSHASPLGLPTVLDGGSFAYLTSRPVTPRRNEFEFGAYGHGLDAGKLVNVMIRHIQSWPGSQVSARIEAHPVGTPDDQLPSGAFVLEKKHTRITISWPLSEQRSPFTQGIPS